MVSMLRAHRDVAANGVRLAARLALVGLMLAALACGADAPTTTRPAMHLTITGGDGQVADPGASLPAPLEVRVLAIDGTPIVGARVAWSASGGGRVDPAESASDADGIARTRWLLGTDAAEQSAVARVEGGSSVTFRASVTGELPSDALHAIALTTFEGSGEVVHPDFARVDASWRAGRDFLAITPYPNGNANYELPSLFASTGAADAWRIPAGASNPVARAPTGYLSDPDLVYDPDARELRLYYRAVESANIVRLIRSLDGVRWSAPVEVARAPNHDLVSPAVVRVAAHEWHLWSVSSGSAGCSASATTVEHRTSTDGIHWSAPARVTLDQPGVSPWHIDVEWLPSRGEYWALFNGKTAGSCTTPALFLATSTDGVRWTTYSAPVLARGALPELADVVYRSTLAYDAERDAVTLWYSGARFGAGRWTWRAATERITRAALLARVASGGTRWMASLAPSSAPPLLDAP
jgi:hypothetical protein